jgi:putative glutamine amidotransferase
MPSYIQAIKAAGGIPLLIPLGLSEEELQVIFQHLDGVLVPGGGDIEPHFYNGRTDVTLNGVDRERDQTELFMARAAIEKRKPILGICRGIQVLNVALGGTLWEDIVSLVPGASNHDMPDDLPRNYLAHKVTIKSDSVLAHTMGVTERRVNSLHHQALRDLAPDLTVTATAPDGIIEGVEVPDHPFAVGVQWHPENLVNDDPVMLSLFKGLVQAVEETWLNMATT